MLVLMVRAVQAAQVRLTVEGGADLERRGGGRRHVPQGQGSLVGDAGPRHRPSGGQSLKLGMDLVVRRGYVRAEAGAGGVGGVRVRHVHARVLVGRERVGVGGD